MPRRFPHHGTPKHRIPENELTTNDIDLACALYEVALARGYDPIRESQNGEHCISCRCEKAVWQTMIAAACELASGATAIGELAIA